MAQVYPENPSAAAGGSLTLRVSTTAPLFRVDFYRQGASLIPMGHLGVSSNPGHESPLHPSDQDWGAEGQDSNGRPLAAWEGYDFQIPGDWPSGAYIAMVTELDQGGFPTSSPDATTPDGRDAKALFVVKSSSRGTHGSILYKLPLLTYHAYNAAGDPPTCFYNGADVVSIRRPGGGTGGSPYDAERYPDVYDQSSPRETFAHWDAPFIAWLESNGYQVEYCTDLDLHTGTRDFLAPYRLLLSVGHDEYWTPQMRANASAFVAGGGNLAFFSGNVAWRQVAFADDNVKFRIAGLWYELGPPENTLTGVSYRNGGGQWDGPRPTVIGYTVQHADSWVYQGSDLKDGDVFGDFYGGDPAQPAALVGYECDGARFDRQQLGQGGAIEPTHEDSTPDGFVILGIGDLTGWQDFPAAGPGTGNLAATMGYFVNQGTVFTSGTSDWSRVLSSGQAPSVEVITRNVIDSLSRPPHP
jgi:N,N-dimethylformamidase beta subunit-like protein